MPFLIGINNVPLEGRDTKKTVMMTEEMKSHFMNLYNMVLADGNVKPEELVKVYTIGLRHGVSPAEFNQLLLSPVSATLPDTLEKKVNCLYDLCEIILADGDIDPNEIAALKRYCTLFGFDEENANSIADFMIDRVKQGKSLESIITEVMN